MIDYLIFYFKIAAFIAFAFWIRSLVLKRLKKDGWQKAKEQTKVKLDDYENFHI